MSQHPFVLGYKRFKDFEREFSYFKWLVSHEIRPFCCRLQRFQNLESACGFAIHADEPFQLRLDFGSRPLFRKNTDGKPIFEFGPTLLYTFGGAGETVILLYTAKSELGSAREGQLYLGIGKYTGYQLSVRIKSDLRALVAYAHTTSLYGSPTIKERLHVWWLRIINPMHVDERYQPSALRRFSMKIFGSIPYNGIHIVVVPVLSTIIIGLAIKYAGGAGWPVILKLLKQG